VKEVVHQQRQKKKKTSFGHIVEEPTGSSAKEALEKRKYKNDHMQSKRNRKKDHYKKIGVKRNLVGGKTVFSRKRGPDTTNSKRKRTDSQAKKREIQDSVILPTYSVFPSTYSETGKR